MDYWFTDIEQESMLVNKIYFSYTFLLGFLASSKTFVSQAFCSPYVILYDS